MIETGRICIKTAGRDAGRKCIIVDIIDDNYVLIDGDVRRKKCNIKHLEPLKKTIKIKKGASHDAVVSEFKKIGIEIKERKSKPKTERPKKQRKKKEKVEEKQAEKKEKSEEKKDENKKVEKEEKTKKKIESKK